MLRYLLIACLLLISCSTSNQAYINKPVRVTGEGRTFEEAKNNAFSNAMEYAVGAVVVTDTQVQQKRLVKDEIIKHSAGYVDDFQVIKRIDEPNHVTVVMDVSVKHSMIAERITNVNGSSGEVQGQRVDGIYTSFIQNKETGDRLLKKILDDYPRAAFIAEKGDVQYMVNIRREPVIVVEYKVKWNQKYIQSLKEVLTMVQDPKNNHLKQEQIDVRSDGWAFARDSYYFNDLPRSNLIIYTMSKKVFISLNFKDDNGKILKKSCIPVNVQNSVNQKKVFVVEGTFSESKTNELTIKANVWKIKQITNVELLVEPGACTNIS